MAVRTYNPAVRVGNWNEDVQLEEDTLKDFLDRKEKGQLLFQKNASLRESILAQTNLSISRDGRVHFGDIIVVMNPGTKDGSRPPTSLGVNYEPTSGLPCGLSSSPNLEPSARNTFHVVSIDGTQEGVPVKFGQPFLLRIASNGLFLTSDRATFGRSARKSRHADVWLTQEPSHLSEWKLQAFDPKARFELDFCDAPANCKLLLTHVKTNTNLNVEEFVSSSFLGKEYEVSCHSQLDSHKAEVDGNHWVMTLQVPGDDVLDVERQAAIATPQQQPATPQQTSTEQQQ